MVTVYEIVALFGLVSILVVAWRINKRYETKDFNTVIKRKYQ